jgi:hypothetical protein
MLQQVINEAECRAVERIQNGSFKQACQAVESFADLVVRLLGQLPSN